MVWMLLNGAFVAEQDAQVPVFDRGCLYGDAAFDTLTVYDGRIFRARQHLERLSQLLLALQIELPRTLDQMEADLYSVLGRNAKRDAILRITVSRGPGPGGASMQGAGPSSYLIACYPPRRGPDEASQPGVRLAIVSVRRTPALLPAHAKFANYLNSILALDEAMERGADEALLLDNRGFIAQCAYSNVFFVAPEGLFTPMLEAGVLPGITRAVVLELAREQGVAVNETLVEPSILTLASEVFLTNTVSGVVAVCAVGGRAFQAPGQVTSRIAQWYWALVEREAGQRWSSNSMNHV